MKRAGTGHRRARATCWSRHTALALGLTLACLVSVTARVARAQPSDLEPSGIDAADVELVRPGEGRLRAFDGATIVAVSVESLGLAFRTRAGQHALVPGEPLSGDAVRRALRELCEGGLFASAHAEVERHPEGVVVRLFGWPRRLVARLRVSVERGRISDADAAVAAGAAEGIELTERRLLDMRQRLEALCQRRGYYQCDIDVATTDTDDPLRVVLAITVRLGEERTISRRIFVVDAAHDAELGDRKSDYAVGAGDPLDEDALTAADQELSEELRADGFLGARVTHAVAFRQDGADAQSFLFVYPNAGPRYRFAFQGQRQFASDELEEALDLSAVTEVNVAELTETLRSFYRDRGFYDARVEAEIMGGPDDRRNDVRLAIDEGERLWVSERLFACLPPDRTPAGEETETAKEGLSADALGAEIDAVLEESLPKAGLLTAPDPVAVSATLGPDDAGIPARPLRLGPARAYTPEAYAQALDHLRDYVQSKGYLNAIVGAPSVLRARCDPRGRGGVCLPLPAPPRPSPLCQTDAVGLPQPEPEIDAALECKPDPLHGVHCSPVISVRIPVQLGPRSTLYDIVFTGNEGRGYVGARPEKLSEERNDRFSSRALASVAALELGGPVSNVDLEAARQRLVDHYRDEGYPYATITTVVDTSPDRTRARVRFEVREHGPVEVTGYVVRGNTRTDRDLILSRLALCPEPEACEPHERLFRRELVRQSEEQIATLGVFSSVSIALEDPEIPLSKKRAIITVVEQGSQYIEPRVGFSSGQGVRVAFEYGHRNVGGLAIGLTLRLELSYLPPPLILDADFRSKYEALSVSEQLERRDAVSLRFPEIGLGPDFSLSVDGIDVRDNQRDFGLTKNALVPTLTYKPVREVTMQLSAPSVELNDVRLFGDTSIAEAIRNNPGLAALLRVPEGRTVAVAERLTAAWDRRDNAFDAKSGTLLSGSVEHVNAFPVDETADITSDFLRLSAKFGGYLKLSEGGVALAIVVSAGYNVQLRTDSQTYPDRQFFLGGGDSLRGFPLDSVVPEDLAQRIIQGEVIQTDAGTRPFTVDDVPIRGGNLYWNPRLELRTPLTEAVALGWFLDTGNVWTSEEAIGAFVDFFQLRYAAGLGVRLATPLGPIVLDYGFNLVRRSWEELGALHFAIGLF